MNSVDDDDDPPATAPPTAVSPGEVKKQRILLVVVITLGVLMLLGFAVLVGGLIMGVGGTRTAEADRPWSYTLDVPIGSHIASTTVQGDRVLVHLVAQSGVEDVVLIDARSGKVLGRVRMMPGGEPRF